MKQTITLWNPQQGHKALADLWPWIKSLLMAGHKMTIEAKPETRSTAQNSLMWSCLTDLSKQVNWYGNFLTPEDWKDVLSAALKKQRAVPGIDGGFVVCGQRTSKMTIAEMSELIELCHAFGADKGVNWSPTSFGAMQ